VNQHPAARGECECLPHSHLFYVEVMLVDICNRPLCHKLRRLVAVVCHLAFSLQSVLLH